MISSGLFTAIVVGGAVATSASPALAETYPNRAITIVVPAAPGSAADLMARRVARQIKSDLGQAVLIDNKVGAGGTIAYQYVARQKPDGYTFQIAIAGFAIANVMYPNAHFDVFKSFTPITQLAISPLVFTTRTGGPFNTLNDLIHEAKEHPGRLRYGSFGLGSSSHLAAASFMKAAQIHVTHVPYQSGAATVPDLLQGALDFALLDTNTAIALMSSGKFKALATSGELRIPALPKVPTAAESGVAFTSFGWLALFAPAGLPKDILDRVAESANKAVQQPDSLAFLSNSGLQVPTPAPTPAQWAQRFRTYVDISSALAREVGMAAE